MTTRAIALLAIMGVLMVFAALAFCRGCYLFITKPDEDEARIGEAKR